MMLPKSSKRKLVDYVMEFVIVLLGISIAFWLSNLGEKRKENRLEEVYLNQLNDDLIEDINSFRRTQEFNEIKIESLNKGISYIEKESGKLVADTIVKYAFLVGNYNFFYPSNHTYLTLQQSGDLAFIRNQELKKKLVSLYQSYDAIKTEQTNLIQALDDNFFPDLYENVDMITGKVVSKDYFKTSKCTNFIAFTKQQTEQLKRLGALSERLAGETADLIQMETGALKSIQDNSN